MSFLAPGHALNHYRITAKIGAGGMGQVYLAEDTKLGRSVAIKILPADSTEDETARRRLLQEARSAAALNHPSIVTIHAIDDYDGLDFIVMEYVEGETLRASIERGPFPLDRLLDIGAQAADALAVAHTLGIVHRDIKSENILITSDQRAKVLDFGLAKFTHSIMDEVNEDALTRMKLTGAGIVLGTVNYMSPEQTRGEPLDGRSDIFSLGCVLYEIATGRLPFTGASVLNIIHNIATMTPLPPSRIRPELPAELDLIIGRALAKDKDQRYQSASELADALRSLRGVSDSLSTFKATDTGPLIADAFVGRELEMRQLDEIVRQTIEGAGRVVLITGEPGIGKSAIVEEFLRRARRKHTGILFSRGRCVEQYGTGEAYLPFLDAVGALLNGAHRERIAALLRTHAPNWCLQFPAVFISSGIWENLQQETMGVTIDRMLREMGDALAALSTTSPTVIVLEDLHWADPSSIDLLRHLCQRIANKRLLIVGTIRPEEVEKAEHPLRNFRLEMQTHKMCEEIALGSLAAEHIAGYIDARFMPNNFPPEFASLVERKTEGHPLFAISLIQYLTEKGDIARLDGHWSLARPLSEMGLETPENVLSMIRKKLEAVTGEDLRALQYASVEGDEFLSTVVAGLLGADEIELEERLAQIARTQRLIVVLGEEELPDGNLATRYRFAHALYQDVLYSDLVTKRRVMLHRQAGELLARHYGKESFRIAAQLAMHFERGRDFKRAVEHLIFAGDNAARLYASREALEHFSRALDLLERLSDDDLSEKKLMLYQKRGQASAALGRFQQAVEDYTEMLKQARALGSLEKESAALNALSMTLFYSHRLDEITARADEIIEAAERAGSDALRVEAMQVIALKHLGYGELKEARPMLDEIVRTSRAIDHKSVLLVGLAWRGILHFFHTEYDEAGRMMKETRALARELRDGFLLLESYFVMGMVLGNQGRMTEALATFEEGMETAARNGDEFWSPRMPNCVGWIYRELQDFDNAVKYDQKGLDVGRRQGVLEAQANSLINLGIDYARAGEREKTPGAFGEVEKIFERDSWFKWRYNIRLQAGKCEHWLAEGNLEKAEEYASKLLEIATQYDARKYIAVAHKLLAQIAVGRGDARLAEQELNEAVVQLKTHPVPIVEWKVQAALGRLLLEKGDTSGARESFIRAAVIISEIAAHVKDERVKEIFLNSKAVQDVQAHAEIRGAMAE